MFDCHYDLLTIILMYKHNKDWLESYFKEVYNSNNITGGIFNLFYMTYNEMKEEIGMDKEDINLIQNLKEAKEFIEQNKIIPEGTKYIFGIEGLDYLENIEDIDVLYDLGLRSVNPVWNNENKFGGGVRASNNIGLTELGISLVEKLVEKNIAIDLSHANEATFWDIINLCIKLKEDGKKTIVFASHSNSKTLCNVPRNLTDEQILAIKNLNGIIGVVSIKNFCVDTEDIYDSNIDFEHAYIEHISYIKKLLGGVENIAVSTDDMKYYYIYPEYYQNINIYPHCDVKTRLETGLKENGYTEKEIRLILCDNFKHKILKRALRN